MINLAKLKIVDSYHDIFTTLTDILSKKGSDIDKNNLVFLEEKVSLMAERHIVSALGGTFNTEVYSFGKFLRAKKPEIPCFQKKARQWFLNASYTDLNLNVFQRQRQRLPLRCTNLSHN